MVGVTKFNQYGKAGRVPVPCASCGMLSTHWFADGSPAWPKHDHGPRPYYSDEFVIIHHGDYLDIGPSLPPADLVFMDPPFNIWASVKAVVSGRTTIAFTTWQHREPVHALFGAPRAELVWAFADGRWVSHNLPRITHETILVFGPTGSAYVGRPTDGVPVRKGTGSIGKSEMGPRTYTPHDRKSLDSVLRYPRDVGSDLGVWSKPLPLVSSLVEWAMAEPGLVIDPFLGSGTSLVAAKALGHRGIGIEIDERACEIAANRCRQEVLGWSA